MDKSLIPIIACFAIALISTFTLIEMQIDEAIDFSKTYKRSGGTIFIIVIKKLVVTILWCYFLYLLLTHK